MDVNIFHFQLPILHLLGLAAIALIGGLLAWPYLVVIWPSIREQIDRFHRLHPLAKVAALLFVGAFVVFGGGKNASTNNGEAASSPLVLNGGFRFLTSGGDAASPLTVTDEDVARGWRLWEVRTNAAVDYAMPPDATLATNWWVRGAYEDVTRIELNPAEAVQHQASGTMHQPWRFPFGTNEYSSLWAFSWGKLRFALADTNTEIVAVGAPMSAVPYHSRLWTSAATNGSRLITWEDFVLGRVRSADYQLPSTNYQLVSAQIELRTTGDFVTRSNEVETVYRRIDPEDWDDDGWRNDDDGDPYCWEDFGDYFYQELPAGANEDAYCWVDIRPKWNSYIEFYGDAPSDLDDPYIYGAAGETYRVHLLIGKTYEVESDRPFEIVGTSDARVEVTVHGPNRAEVVWPVEFTVAEGRAPTGRPLLGATWNEGGKSFYVLPNPPWLRGAVTWTDNFCCDVWGDGTNFTYACDNTCTCTGCTVYGSYWYEGYALPVWGIPCGCVSVPDDGNAEIVEFRFTKAAAIYEEPYVNTPGETVTPSPSTSTLRCVVRGGTYGGRLTVSLNAKGNAKLRSAPNSSLPSGVEIAPGTMRTFEIEYTPIAPSDSTNDIVATAYLDENFLGSTYTRSATLTSVKVELETRYEAPANPDKHRHVYGIAEDVYYRSYPGDANVVWSFPVEFIDRGEGLIMCPWSALGSGGTISVQARGVSYGTTCAVVEPTIEARNPRVNAESGEVSPVVGEAGHLLLYLDLYVVPSYVSFQGVQMRETPDESQSCPHQGYFDDRTKGGNWSHTANDGAGEWYTVQSSGYVMTDKAGRRMAYQPPWVSGWKEWAIPMEWGEGGVISVPFNPNPTTQRFELQSDGGFVIRKHGHFAERNVFGLKWCDGELAW